MPVDRAQAGGDPIVVIVNVANPVDNLSLGELKKLFLVRSQPLGYRQSRRPGHGRAGSAGAYCISENSLWHERQRLRQVFSASRVHWEIRHCPKGNEQLRGLKSFVANSPGAIGFVKAGDFHGDGSDGGVKAVKVDGTAAGDASYKLRM